MIPSSQETSPLLLCLCQPQDHWKLIPGYVEAFRRKGYEMFCVGGDIPLDMPLSEIVKSCPRPPSAVLHFDSALPLLPDGVAQSDIPTVCFHPDTYAFTERRLRWSFLFDHVATFHPGYDTLFQSKGHPGAFLLPHAVRREFFDLPEIDRVYEVGWVGRLGGSIYQRRARVLDQLAQNFLTNDRKKECTLQEVAEVYRRSRIVVNIGRDDFPQDANLRVFEVLASGALLLTSLPTELTHLGFQEGTHFVGFSNESEIVPLVHSFLRDESQRARISNAGRAKVLKAHTYDERAGQLLERLRKYSNQRLAPARSWPLSRARLMALDFFAGSGVFDCAFRKLWQISGRDLGSTMEGAKLLARSFGKKFLGTFLRRKLFRIATPNRNTSK
jgi:Glycosyl transferases group 1